ncbi:hypothetical protein RRG08_050132, partial [Elysia crispata]
LESSYVWLSVACVTCQGLEMPGAQQEELGITDRGDGGETGFTSESLGVYYSKKANSVLRECGTVRCGVVRRFTLNPDRTVSRGLKRWSVAGETQGFTLNPDRTVSRGLNLTALVKWPGETQTESRGLNPDQNKRPEPRPHSFKTFEPRPHSIKRPEALVSGWGNSGFY